MSHHKYKPGDFVVQSLYWGHATKRIGLVLDMYTFKDNGFTKKIVVYILEDQSMHHCFYDPSAWQLLTEKSKLK